MNVWYRFCLREWQVFSFHVRPTKETAVHLEDSNFGLRKLVQMPPQQMFRPREHDQKNVAKTWNVSFHVVLIQVIFLLKNNQTTMIFGIGKQKKMLPTQRCCFQKPEKLNQHVECAPITKFTGYQNFSILRASQAMESPLSSVASVRFADSAACQVRNFGLTHFPWNFPTLSLQLNEIM